MTKFTCPDCGKTQTRIGVTSECRQTLNLKTDEYTNLEVGDTQHCFCIECGVELPKEFNELITKAGQ